MGEMVPLLAAVRRPSLTVLPETVPSATTGLELEPLVSSLDSEEFLLESTVFFEDSVILESSVVFDALEPEESSELLVVTVVETDFALESSEPEDFEVEESSAMAGQEASMATAISAVRRENSDRMQLVFIFVLCVETCRYRRAPSPLWTLGTQSIL